MGRISWGKDVIRVRYKFICNVTAETLASYGIIACLVFWFWPLDYVVGRRGTLGIRTNHSNFIPHVYRQEHKYISCDKKQP